MDSNVLLREYLMATGFRINEERISLDEKRLYTIIRANYDKPYDLSLIEKLLDRK